MLDVLGTVWIVGGRILSLRGDLFPPEFCVELGRVRDPGVAFPFAVARRIVEEQLGGPLEQVFSSFSETPFAANSIAQLHRAHLRHEDVAVAVKIQQPGAEAAFAADFRLIRRVAAVLGRLGIPARMNWDGLCRELQQAMTRELHFAYEAASLKRLQATLRPHGVYAPDVFDRYSGARLLVMEYLQGALVSDFIDLRRRDPVRLERWLQENDIVPRRVGRRLFNSVFRQVLEDNLFHGDLHPHNLVLLRNSRLAVLDCRSVGSLDAEHLSKHALYLQAIANYEFGTAADVQFLLSTHVPQVRLDAVKEALIRVWRVWEGRTHVPTVSYHDRSLTAMLTDVGRVAVRHGFSVQWSMSRLARSFANLDASLEHLHPKAHAPRWLRRYFDDAARRRRARDARHVVRRRRRALMAAARLPQMVTESTVLQQGVIRRQAHVLAGSTTKAGELLGAAGLSLARGLAVVGLGFTLAYVDRRGLADITPFAGAQIASVIHALPAWPPWVWLVGTVSCVAGERAASTLARRFRQSRVRLREAPPAV